MESWSYLWMRSGVLPIQNSDPRLMNFGVVVLKIKKFGACYYV